MSTILDKITAAKRTEIERCKAAVSEAELRSQLADLPPVLDFFAALAVPDKISLIAEVKKASPSAGIIREDFDPVQIAKIYEANGASCISVLTDQPFFQGHLDFLRQIRPQVNLPLLRKDFILDVYQIVEARTAGADAVLLIAECLDDKNLQNLFNETVSLGMTPLVELYEPSNLQRVLDLPAKLIGINNRNLHTFETDLNHTIGLRKEIPDDCLVVGESGIRSHDDVCRLQVANVDAILVGESLMRNSDIGAAVRSLLGQN